MSVVFTRVSTVDVQRIKNSIRTHSILESRSTASFTVYDETGALSFSQGDTVEIVRAGFPPFVKLLFEGVIDNVTETRIPVSDVIYHDIVCTDYHYYADKRLAAKTYTDVDVGAAAINRGGTLPLGSTYIGADSPALSSGRVTEVEIWANVNITTCTVGTFYVVSGNVLRCRDSVAIGAVVSGSAQAYTVDLEAQAGDYLGCYFAGAGSIEYDNAGFAGVWSVVGDVTTPSDDDTFAFGAGDAISLHATGSVKAGDIVNDLFETYLEPEGITIGEIQDGPDIGKMVISYKPVSDALDALANQAGFIWYIDFNQQLFFVARSTTAAPFAVTTADIIKNSSSLKIYTPFYRNRQFIRGGKETTDLLVPLVESYTGDGAIKAFTVGYPIHQEPVVTVGGVEQDIGIKGIDTTEDCYWVKGDPIVVFDDGSIPGAVAVVITYIGEYDILVQVDDAVEQATRAAAEGSTGIVESIAEEPDVDNKDDAFAIGESMLARLGVAGNQFRFAIETWGLEPGQLVTVTDAAYGLAAVEMLIESVTANEVSPGVMYYSVSAISGPEVGDWTNLFKRLAGQKDELISLLVGGDQTLITFNKESELWEWLESVTETPFACPVCAPTLICGPTIICC